MKILIRILIIALFVCSFASISYGGVDRITLALSHEVGREFNTAKGVIQRFDLEGNEIVISDGSYQLAEIVRFLDINSEAVYPALFPEGTWVIFQLNDAHEITFLKLTDADDTETGTSMSVSEPQSTGSEIYQDEQGVYRN